VDLTFTILIFLTLISLLASTVNGGLGYGYSSISAPLALLVVVNRVINPVYVAVEACTNTVMLALSGKANIRATFRRILPIVAGLVPAIIVGSYLLFVVSPAWVRFAVYASILPLVLLQAGGFRHPIKSERTAGAPLGFGVGMLYSISTISGPPISLFFNNQGLPKGEFRAAIAQIRLVESYLTTVAYFSLGLFTVTSFQILTWVAPPVIIGIPAGVFIVKHVRTETFRRVCMSFDTWIAGYGLAVVMGTLFGMVNLGYAVMMAGVGIDAALLYRFFGKLRRVPPPLGKDWGVSVPGPLAGGEERAAGDTEVGPD
jgi:uncharacterized protein